MVVYWCSYILGPCAFACYWRAGMVTKNIKAGADIHAGGGYEEGTQEGYEAFLKVRNNSLTD